MGHHGHTRGLWYEDCMFHGPMGIPEGCGLGIGHKRAMDRDIGMLRSCAVPMVLWYSCACSVVPMGTPEGYGPRYGYVEVTCSAHGAVVRAVHVPWSHGHIRRLCSEVCMWQGPTATTECCGTRHGHDRVRCSACGAVVRGTHVPRSHGHHRGLWTETEI